jgi:Zn-dependent metalloprotease
MKAPRLSASIVALVAGCAAPGAGTDDQATPTFRIDQRELARGGVPYLLRGELGRIAAPIPATATSLASSTTALSANANAFATDALATDALASVLPAIAGALRVPAADLRPVASSRDDIGMTHVRLAQHKNGMRVVGGEVTLHIGADGVVRSVTSSARDRALDASPAISAAAAAQLAVSNTSTAAATTATIAITTAAATTATIAAAAATELVYVVSARDHDLHLAWQVRVVSLPGAPLLDDLVYVDALTGAVVDRHPQIHPVLARTIRDGQGHTYPPVTSTVIGTEGNPPASDTIGRAAYDNTGITYDCYQSLFGRNSYDGNGAPLTSVVHTEFALGGGPNNAIWDGQARQMAYGDGDGDLLGPLAYALDVTAHELTHAVTDATADLVYMGESGALNEAMSDILGAVCEAWASPTPSPIPDKTWLVGEDVFTPSVDGDALRYMSNPTLDGQSRDYYPERYMGPGDNEGVHLNSGIANLAFYLLVAGGHHPRNKTTLTVPAIGMDKARQIFYRALTQGYFTPSTQFTPARGATELVALERYDAATRDAVSAAWAAVGVPAPPSDVTPPVVEIVSPADGAHVVPGFSVRVNASDNIGVVQVELRIDGISVGSLTAPPYDFTVGSQLSARDYVLSAVAYDATLNLGSDKATVTADVPCSGGSCEPEPRDDSGGGCCSAGPSRNTRGAVSSLALLLATAFALRRRRPRG